MVKTCNRLETYGGIGLNPKKENAAGEEVLRRIGRVGWAPVRLLMSY